MVPKGWEKLKISNICKLQNGNSFKPTDWGQEGLPIIRIQNLNGSSNFNYFSGRPQEKWLVAPGQLLFSWAGTKGISFGPFIWRGPKGVLNQHIYKVYAEDSIIKEWLYSALKWVTNNIETQAHGFKSTLLHVKKKDIDNQVILVPPIAEQKKIAQILSTWDKAITITEQLLANSQQQKKALMQQLLTGKKRLLDENGVRFGDKWEKMLLKEILREEKSRNKNCTIERVLSITNNRGFILPEDQFSKRVASSDVRNYKIVKKGQYGYNPSRINVGSFARLDNYSEGLLSPMYIVFSINEKTVYSNYFVNWMASDEVRQRIERSTQGSVRNSVGFDALCSLPIKLPSMEEQQKIAAVLSAADKKITVLQQKLDMLEQEKKALMQQLLTGKRRVKIEKAA